jgi:hypothetical protein
MMHGAYNTKMLEKSLDNKFLFYFLTQPPQTDTALLHTIYTYISELSVYEDS